MQSKPALQTMGGMQNAGDNILNKEVPTFNLSLILLLGLRMHVLTQYIEIHYGTKSYFPLRIMVPKAYTTVNLVQ